MRIAIDAHTVGTQLAGNVTYITSMIESLARIDQKNDYSLYVMEPAAIEMYQDRWPNFQVRRFMHKSRIMRYFYSFSSQLRVHPADIFFCQFNAPPFCPAKIVTAIHDLSFEHLPETFTKQSSTQMKITIRRTAKNAKHIIACSEYSRQDILKTYGIAENKVSTVHLAAPEWYAPVEDKKELERIRVKYDLGDTYILGVGSIQPRKNLVRLIEAYASLVKRGIDMPKLVLAGKKAWLFEDSVAATAVHGVEDRVHFTGFVPDEDLIGLYTGALCFVYPSFFEGFGLPPLEAMQCGTPVIAGNLTSLPEVVGDAGLLVDPFDVESIAKALEQIVGDENLRKTLIAKGIEQAAKFKWDDAAQKTLDIFERVHANK